MDADIKSEVQSLTSAVQRYVEEEQKQGLAISRITKGETNTELLRSIHTRLIDMSSKIDDTAQNILSIKHMLEYMQLSANDDKDNLAKTIVTMASTGVANNTISSDVRRTKYGKYIDKWDIVTAVIIQTLELARMQLKEKHSIDLQKVPACDIVSQKTLIQHIAGATNCRPKYMKRHITIDKNSDGYTTAFSNLTTTKTGEIPDMTSDIAARIWRSGSTFVREIEELMHRLTLVRVFVPRYYADILASLEYPVIDLVTQEVSINHADIKDRIEDDVEAKGMKMKSNTRKKIAVEVLEKGGDIRLRVQHHI